MKDTCTISVENVSKVYSRSVTKPGFLGAVQAIIKPKYTEFAAVTDLSFSLNQGEIVGFIGANGAGKSTTIKMLSGILVPSKGRVSILGLDPTKDREKLCRHIGVVFGQRSQLWWDIALRDTFDLLREIYEVPDDVYKRNIEIFFDVLDIKNFFDVPVRQLSLGQRMQGELCAALLHNPSVLFLDEPTIGLDVDVKNRIRTFIIDYNKIAKTTVLLTTHDMGDIEKLCNRLIIIDKGKLLFDGSMKVLTGSFFDYTKEIIIDLAEGNDFELPQMEGLVSSAQTGNRHTFKINTNILPIQVFLNEVLRTASVSDMKINEVRVEDIVSNIYGGQRLKNI